MLTIREAIQQIVKDNEEIYSLIATVTEVDENKRTIDAKPIDGSAEIFDVRLQAAESGATGFVQIPENGSEVVITFLSKDTAFVSLCTSVTKLLVDSEEMTINGGNNGGLINISSLVDKINALEDLVNSLLTDYKVHTHNAPQAPSGVIPTTPLLVPFTGLNIAPITTVNDLEDTKITH